MATLIPFSYNEVYQGIAQKLIDKGYDAPYEGSNTAMLCSILAYTAQAINFNAATNISESILTLATKRKNVIQDARILSYEPKARISTQLKITLKAKSTGVIKVSQYQKFTIDGYEYYYMGSDFTKSLNEEEIFSIIVKQGTLLKHTDYSSVLEYTIDENEYIDIPFDDVENDGLVVTVDTYDSFGNKRDNVSFTKSEFNLMRTSQSDVYFRQDDLDTSNCRIFFKLGGYGSKLRDGSRVYVNVLRSDGASANADSYQSITIDGDLNELLEPIISGENRPQIYVYGQDEESIDSIKENAPLFYSAAGSCITKYDYKAFLSTKSSILEGQVWGGEDELISTTGTIFYCCIPEYSAPSFTVNGASYDSTQSYSSFDSIMNEDYKKNLFLADGDFIGSEGILDTIAKYSPPGLKSYIKNPVYFYCDVNVDVKKYEYGAVQSEINKQIFDAINAYFNDRLGFNQQYIETALIAKISDIVGGSNGFEFTTYLSLGLDDKNCVQIVSKDFDYNSNIIQYVSSKEGDLFLTKINLNAQCSEGDSISILYDRKIETSLLDSATRQLNVKVTSTDLLAYQKTIYVSIPENPDVICQWISKSQNSKVYAKEAPKVYPNTYYTCSIRNGVYVLNVLLNPDNEIGDKYDVFYEKAGTLTKIDLAGFNIENKLTKSDLAQGEINVTIVDNQNTIKGVENVDSIVIKFIKSETVKVLDDMILNEDVATEEELEKATTKTIQSYRNSVRCETIEECKSNLEEDTKNLYKNLDTNTFFISTQKVDEENYTVSMYLTKYMGEGDSITLTLGETKDTYLLTQDDITTQVVNYTLNVGLPKVQALYYNSKDSILMQVVEENSVDYESLIKEIDDRIQFKSNEITANTISYVPTSSSDTKVSFKTDYVCTFYKQQDNRLDIRNLILNYGSNDKLDTDGKNTNVDISQVEFSGFDAEYEFPYIKLLNPQKTGILQVYAEMNVMGINGGYYSINFQIPVVESNSEALTQSEGIGGIYIHLDLPPEGIFSEEGNLIRENLPKFYGLEIDNGEDILNPEAIDTIIENVDSIDSLIWVDFNNKVTPYFSEITIKDNVYGWLKFPIYYKSQSTEAEQIGTYMIIQGSNPYIRIKLRNHSLNYLKNLDFGVVYPSNNFTFIKNSAIRLRSVTFNHSDNTLRNNLRDLDINEDLFQNSSVLLDS